MQVYDSTLRSPKPERTRSDLAISLTRSMLLFQLIPVSLRQILKTIRKVTNLRAESLTVPRA